MGRIWRRSHLFILLFFGLWIGGQIFTASPASGEAKKERVKISLGHLPHLTGAYAAGQVGANDAFLDVIAWMNENNYLPGVELVALWADGGTDVAKSTAAFKKMISENPRPVTILGQSTPVGIALKSWHLKEMVPDLEGGISNDFFQLPSATFSYFSPYTNQAGAFIDYFMKNIWKEKRAPRFAWLTWDNPAGRAPITPEVEAFIKSKGIEIVGAEFIPMVPTDVTPHLLRLKKDNIDVVYGCAYHNALAVVLKDANKLGLLGTFTMGVMSWVAPYQLIQQVGPLADGIWQTSNYILDEDMPTKAPIIYEIYNKNKRSSDKLIYMSAARGTVTAVEAIKMAIAKVGAEKTDGKAVYDALTQMKNFDNWGLGPKTSFSETRRYGQEEIIMYHIENRKPVRVGVFPTPELIPGGKDAPKQ